MQQRGAQPLRAILSWWRSACMLAATATSIIFGLGSFRLFMRSTYSATDLTLRRGLNCLFSPIVETLPPLSSCAG
jgi:hypothetical protein